MNPELFKGIKQLIVTMAIAEYPASNIFAAFQNNLKYPENNNFIIITELHTVSMAMMPAWQYYPDLIGDQETEEYDQLDSTSFQVDFYGAASRSAASKFRLILQSSMGSDYLDQFACNVHEVGELLNLTGVLDREQYTKRFAVKFSLFNNNNITELSPGFNAIDPNLRLAEVQT